MIFFYIRHGDPIYDPDSLTPLGMRQAEAVAKRLSLYGVDKIYSSTSNRAIQTAKPTCELMKKEMELLEEAILRGDNIREDEVLEKHADWAEKWMAENEVTKENIHGIVQAEIGKVFAKVLECAGVYKQTEEGMKAFDRFVKCL